LRFEETVPEKTVAYDVAADAQEAGGPELILLAIVVGGLDHGFVDHTIQMGMVTLILE